MSGGDKRFIEIATRLSRTFEMFVVTSLLGMFACEKSGMSGKYFITTWERKTKNFLILYAKRLIRALSLRLELKAGDILYSTSDFLPDIFPPFICKLKNRKVKWVASLLLLAQNPFYPIEQHYWKQKKAQLPRRNEVLFKLSQLISIKLMKWKADKILVLNFEIMEYLLKKGIKSDKIEVIDCGVDLCQIEKTELLYGNNKYDACFVGRFHPQKGIFDLIEIWELVCTQVKNAKLCIIGRGNKEFERTLRAEIKRRNLAKNIDLLGFMDGEKKFGTIKSSKIFLNTSHYESWCMVIAEAIASGLPVVAYDLPIFERIFLKGIIRVPLRNKNRFANEIVKLLTNQKLRNRVATEGKFFIRKYDWDRIVAKELNILSLDI